MKALWAQLKARPHLSASVLAGTIVVLATPASQPWVLRLLLGWNAVVWLYLMQAAFVMSRADRHHVKRTAVAQAEGAGAVLATATAAAIASMAAIALELAAAKTPGNGHALPHIAFAIFTVAGSWLLLPTLFSLSYASMFYQQPDGDGLEFPRGSDPTAPHYWDFLYFSFTIAVASQTADVAITRTAMRRLVLLQAVLSFVFNTSILALAVNIAAGLI